jgi:hypothetical protein
LNDKAVERVYRVGIFFRWGVYLFAVLMLLNVPFCVYRALIDFPIPSEWSEMPYKLSPRTYWSCGALTSAVVGVALMLKIRSARRWGRPLDD